MRQHRDWWQKPLAEFSEIEWEQLCDGCGLCCLNKLIDADTDEIYLTNVACEQLQLDTGRCKHYATRFEYEPSCIKLTKDNIDEIAWLPSSCAYRLIKEGKSLPNWHPLRSSSDNRSRFTIEQRIQCKVVYESEVVDWEEHLLPLELPEC